ncbi:peptidoglycan DD-metalloendopeptidase family protein [Paenibacillus thiaminolyticus]|uniref:peptidoglycan DD-metalloendopeptidase family protein n=1 Tax=Paenibacillus thiaminolyticus TaxID=49283 RepID=UPI0035A6E317
MERYDSDHRTDEKHSDSASRWQQIKAAWRRMMPESAQQWIAAYKKQLGLTLGGVALIAASIWGGTAYVHANTVAYFHVYNNSEWLGTVSNVDELESFYAKKQQEEQEKYPNAHIQIDTKNIHTEPDSGFKAKPTTEETIAKLDSALKPYAAGVQLKVNGKNIGIVKDETTAEKILVQIKSKYSGKAGAGTAAKEVKVLSAPVRSANATKAMSRVESVEFRERVSMEESNTDPQQVLQPEEALRMLTTGVTKPVKYAVKEGDTLSSIAQKQNVPLETIYRNNPNVGEEVLKSGQELDLTDAKPMITVKTVEAYSEYLVTEPQRIIKEDPDMRAGESKVVRKGKQGLKRMSYRLTKDNGKLTHEEWIEQEVIEPSVPEIILRGTKVVRGEGSGTFDWPVNGATLTSGFGSRWGRTHKGIDLVSSNRSIMAADEGVVVFAGQKSGYGNAIIVDHNNGYKTLYGHLNSIGVNVGDIVEKGQDIGVMGNTGNSTGTHLHFEIHVNDEVQNPLKYL